MTTTRDPFSAGSLQTRLESADRLLTEIDQSLNRTHNDQAAAIVDLLDRLAAAPEPAEAYHTLVKELERHLGCRGVVLGLATPDSVDCRIAASSTDFEPADQARLNAVMAECLARGDSGLWPPAENSSRHALLAHAALARASHSESVFSIPLPDRKGTVQGVLIVLGDQSFSADETARRFLRAAARPVGSMISLIKQAGQVWWSNRAGQITALVRSHKFLSAIVGAVIFAGAMLLPVPYCISCQCQLEPAMRRFAAAPFEGKLERVEVEPGDLVSEGQLLAVMDGREIRWELASLLAEQSEAETERAGHLARHEFGAAQLSRLQGERLRIREQLLSRHSENLEIRSPTAGIILLGDLKKSEGMPLTTGETLFEIAPLERMLVEVAIPAADLPWASLGQRVDFVLDAYPDTTWTGTLDRIHPRSELREDEHVFIGEVLVENPDAVLRPGMRGRAEIEGPRKTLGWTLFHKPWHEFRFWLGW